MADKTKYRIEEIPGEHGCYHVYPSSGNGDPYLIDLYENKGVGCCSCDDYRFRCYQNYKKHGFFDYGSSDNPHPKRSICRHLKLVRTKFLNDLLETCYFKYRVAERN